MLGHIYLCRDYSQLFTNHFFHMDQRRTALVTDRIFPFQCVLNSLYRQLLNGLFLSALLFLRRAMLNAVVKFRLALFRFRNCFRFIKEIDFIHGKLKLVRLFG